MKRKRMDAGEEDELADWRLTRANFRARMLELNGDLVEWENRYLAYRHYAMSVMILPKELGDMIMEYVQGPMELYDCANVISLLCRWNQSRQNRIQLDWSSILMQAQIIQSWFRSFLCHPLTILDHFSGWEFYDHFINASPIAQLPRLDTATTKKIQLHWLATFWADHNRILLPLLDNQTDFDDYDFQKPPLSTLFLNEFPIVTSWIKK